MSQKKQLKESDPLPLPEQQPQTKESHDLFISPDQREKQEAEDADVQDDLAGQQKFKTQHSDGHTYNPHQAAEQGLTYTPPTDPPVLPSENDPQGVEVAAGFALSMEDSNPDVERLPSSVDNNDLDLLEDIYVALHNNSETGNLTNVKVQVYQGTVNLIGTVPQENDIGLVDEIVGELEGVISIKNNLQVEYESL